MISLAGQCVFIFTITYSTRLAGVFSLQLHKVQLNGEVCSAAGVKAQLGD